MIRLSALAAVSLLAACVSMPPPYAPATSARATGYSESQIESDRYSVTYRAASGAEASLLQDYALLRAAELTLTSGRDWFWVDRRTLDETPQGGGPSVGIGVGGGSWGGRSGASVGVGVNFPLGGQRQRARSATLEIRFGEGPKQPAENAYDARSTAANLRARLAQPR